MDTWTGMQGTREKNCDILERCACSLKILIVSSRHIR